MWHEARRQEKLIRGLIVDYRRRAERRKDFYEKIKAEPTQFLQLHGRPCKIHLDPAVAAAGEGPAIMMPWQGDTNNMIDRFDVRAHLDYIPDVKVPHIPAEDLDQEERQCNYERYRILAQNTFLGISEEKFLQQLAIEEQFGITIEEKEMQRDRLSEKKGTGVAIGYNYNDPGAQPSCSNGPDKKTESKDSDDESDLEIIDVDLSIDVNKMEAAQAHELNAVGPQFGMSGCDLFSFLTGDADDAEHQKQLLREEKEKALFSGRKSRRERRAHRDKKLPPLPTSPPSYAAPTEKPNTEDASPTKSNSRSPSPEVESIEFITSFGPEDEERSPPPPKPLYSEKLKKNLKRNLLYSEAVRKSSRSRSQDSQPRPVMGPRFRDSISRSRSRSRSKSRSYSKSSSRSRRSRSSGSSTSYSTSRSRSRSRSYRRRSRSGSNYGSGKRKRSRSMSFDGSEKNVTKSVPRYYGRRKEDKSSSELSLDSESSGSENKYKSSVGNKSKANQNQLRLNGSSSKGTSREALTMKERLKRKMQAQLSRQLRADKRAEAERLERENRRQARRDEEMRELAIKLRRKQREMRHQQSRHSSDEDSDKSRSSSSARKSPSPAPRKERSKSKSRTPEKRIQVWESDEVSPYRQKYQEIDPRRRYYEEENRDDRYRTNSRFSRGRRVGSRGGYRQDHEGPSRRDGESERKVKLVDY
ncbi:unnamed protein product [Leptosia nina]|uniref:Suppressor of white apricot N-terminal domain-containing protein n=1 Tax=Leptosia nina TaxID=320188 RepID=A0AAV1J4C4_9NEOP